MTYLEYRRIALILCALSAVNMLPDDLPAKTVCQMALGAAVADMPGDVREEVLNGEMPKELWDDC